MGTLRSSTTFWMGLLVVAWGAVEPQPCPAQCSCTGTTVDCHGQGLRAVPRNIPRNAERLDLNGNNLTRITKSDFAGLRHLRVLQLMENKISTIERGAFQDLKELERLRLNRNNLQVFPELLFLGTTKLYRLNLGHGSTKLRSCGATFHSGTIDMRLEVAHQRNSTFSCGPFQKQPFHQNHPPPYSLNLPAPPRAWVLCVMHCFPFLSR